MLYYDGDIRVSETDADFDYVGYIENVSDEDIEIHFMDSIKSIIVPSGDYIGLMPTKIGYAILEAFRNKRFEEVYHG